MSIFTHFNSWQVIITADPWWLSLQIKYFKRLLKFQETGAEANSLKISVQLVLKVIIYMKQFRDVPMLGTIISIGYFGGIRSYIFYTV